MASKSVPKVPRGEIAELTASLQGLCTVGKRSGTELRMQKRDVFKKVINLLTVGMDMSSLFPSMTSCANLSPDDVVLKKQLYLYLTHYAASTPDLALLTINQLHKDCVDQDPTIRGLALRALCSLRVPNFLEYVCSPVLQGLDDRHPYVRRTAVMGVLKIHHIDQAMVENTGLLEKVARMLRSDSDPQVLANCLTVMMQINDPKQVAEKAILYNLLNRLKEFNEWSQCQVLSLVVIYEPSSEQEVYDLLNVLEDRLSVSNSAVVLATAKAFLHHTLSMPATHQQVLERIREPLKSIIGRDDPAVTYAVLAHVLLLTQRAPIIFEQDHAAFYCRTHDPWYIKSLKMEILSNITTSTNVYDVLNELTEYARDRVHPNMAREAVRAVGRIALGVPNVPGIIERLLLFLESGCDEVVSEALIAMKDLLRRYPDIAEVVVAQIMQALTPGGVLSPDALAEPAARAALLWVIGQFGQHIPEAPYLLEPMLEGWASEDERVKLALLTATAQLFFKRPPECQALLGGVLAAGVADTNQDAHDRALLYSRLLRINIAEAERIINPPLMAVSAFSEALTPEMKDAIFSEFNTLAVVYQMPASSFIEDGVQHQLLTEEPSEQDTPAHAAPHAPLVDNATNLLDDLDEPLAAAALQGPGMGGGLASDLDLLGGDGIGNEQRPLGLDLSEVLAGVNGAVASSLLGFGDLSSLGQPPPGTLSAAKVVTLPNTSFTTSRAPLDLLGLTGLGGPAPQAQPPAVSAPREPDLQLDSQARIAPRTFQDRWKSLAVTAQSTQALTPATVAAMAANAHKDFTSHMTQAYIQTTASGGQPPAYKYYFYGQAVSGTLFLVEVLVSTTDYTAAMTFKTDAGSTRTARQFEDIFKACVQGFVRG